MIALLLLLIFILEFSILFLFLFNHKKEKFGNLFYSLREIFSLALGDAEFGTNNGMVSFEVIIILQFANFFIIKILILNLIIAVITIDFQKIALKGEAEYTETIYQNYFNLKTCKEFGFCSFLPSFANFINIPIYFYIEPLDKWKRHRINKILCKIYYVPYFIISFSFYLSLFIVTSDLFMSYSFSSVYFIVFIYDFLNVINLALGFEL